MFFPKTIKSNKKIRIKSNPMILLWNHSKNRIYMIYIHKIENNTKITKLIFKMITVLIHIRAILVILIVQIIIIILIIIIIILIILIIIITMSFYQIQLVLFNLIISYKPKIILIQRIFNT